MFDEEELECVVIEVFCVFGVFYFDMFCEFIMYLVMDVGFDGNVFFIIMCSIV